jgi:hypothetical protein
MGRILIRAIRMALSVTYNALDAAKEEDACKKVVKES